MDCLGTFNAEDYIFNPMMNAALFSPEELQALSAIDCLRESKSYVHDIYVEALRNQELG